MEEEYIVTELAKDEKVISIDKTIQICKKKGASATQKTMNDSKNFIYYNEIEKIMNAFARDGFSMQILGILPAGITRSSFGGKGKPIPSSFTTLKKKNEKTIKNYNDPNYWNNKVLRKQDFEKFVSVQIIYWKAK